MSRLTLHRTGASMVSVFFTASLRAGFPRTMAFVYTVI